MRIVKPTEFTHVSLFSGIGGLDIATHKAGFKTIQFVEREPFCQKVLGKNFPGVPIHDDVTTFDGRPFMGKVDLLSGGFPCQDVSSAHDNDGIEGDRSSLFREILRLACEIRPKFVLMENVTGLFARGFGTVLGEISEYGMDAEWATTSAAAFGSPHVRERVWIVAYPCSVGFDTPTVFKRVFNHCTQKRNQYNYTSGSVSGRHWVTPPLPRSIRMDDGIRGGMDADRVKACGNAIDWRQALPICQAIADAIRLQRVQ